MVNVPDQGDFYNQPATWLTKSPTGPQTPSPTRLSMREQKEALASETDQAIATLTESERESN